jgi:hypothetical protein
MFNSSHQQIDIVLTKDDIHTLANIIIANPMNVNLFLPTAIEVCECLHKQVNVFLHNCVNTIWSLKGLEGSHLSILVTFIH